MPLFPERLKRFRVSVAPLLTGKRTDGIYIADLYKKAKMTIGMRFHSNVISIANGTPSIGIGNSVKVRGMFEEINEPDMYINIDEHADGSWVGRLKNQVTTVLEKPFVKEKIKDINEQIEFKETNYLNKMKKFLENNGVRGLK